MRRAPFTCTLPLIAVLAVGCRGGDATPRSATSDAGEPTNGGTMIIASAGEPETLFPALAQTQEGRHITDQVFDRLAEIGDSLNTVGDRGFSPRLARRWTIAPDGRSVVFELDPRARWHDGRPVRANDVRYSWRVSVDPKVGSPLASMLGNIDSVQVRDSLTPVVWFKRATPEAFYDFVYQVQIVPEHVYGAIPDAQLRTAEVSRRPIGSGRFRFVRWEPGARLELAADEKNYRGRPRLDRVIFVHAADFDAAITRLMAKEADMFENVLPDHLPRLRSDSAIRILSYPGLQTAFVAFNLRPGKAGAMPAPIFTDIAVRRALAMAVDRKAMLRNVFDSLGNLAVGPLPRAHPAADSTLRLPAFDVAGANRLLDSAGWKAGPEGVRTKNGRPLAFSLLVPSSSKARNAYAVLLEQAFRAVGARAAIEQVDFPTFIQRTNTGTFDVAIHAIGVDPSPSTLRQYWTTEAVGKPGGNLAGYSNPTFDAMLDSLSVTRDAEQARALAVRATQRLADDVPAIWLYDVLTLGAAHRRLRPAVMRADAWWAGLADWWIPEGERLPRDRAPVVAAR